MIASATKSIGKALRCLPVFNSRALMPLRGFATEGVAADPRYSPANEIPSHLSDSLHSDTVFSPGFSIRGQFLEGRAAYLDFQVRLCDHCL